MVFNFGAKVTIFGASLEIILILLGKYTNIMFGRYSPLDIAGTFGICLGLFLLLVNYIVFRKIKGGDFKKNSINILILLFLFASCILAFDFLGKFMRLIYPDELLIALFIYVFIVLIMLIFFRKEKPENLMSI